MILDVALFGSNGTDPPAVFLHRLDEKHPLSEDVFIVNQFGYWTAISRLGLSGRVNCIDRNEVRKYHLLRISIEPRTRPSNVE